MIALTDFVAQVRALVGTPYQHRGRLPGVSLDCVGVPIAAMRRVGLEVSEPPPYGTIPAGSQLLAGMQAYCDEIGREAAQPGDLVAIFWGSEPRHVGVLIDRRRDGTDWMVHARARNGRVCCEPVTSEYRPHSYWRVRGLG